MRKETGEVAVASLLIILYIRVSFLFFLRSARVSHPVSVYKELAEANIGRPVTILAALSWSFSNLFESF